MHLELKEELNSTDHSVLQRMKVKLDSLDANSKKYHFAVVDIAEEDAQEAEQEVLDDHNDGITEIIAHI